MTAIAVVPSYVLLSMIDAGLTRAVVANIIIVAAPLCGAGACWNAWRAARGRVWLLLAAFCALWGAGQFVWAVQELVGHHQLFPSLADVGYLAALPFALSASMHLPRRSRGTAFIALLDGTVVAASLLLVSWALLGPALPATARTADVWLSVIYPSADVAVLTVMITAARSVPGPWAQWLHVVAGFVAITTADLAFAVLTANDHYATGNVIDLGWILGFLLIAIGALGVPHRPASAPDPRQVRGEWLTLLLPYVFVVPSGITLAWLELARGTVEPVLTYVGLGLLSALTLRTVLALIESERRADALLHEMTFDSLTGLWNRRTVSRHLDRLAQQNDPFAAVAINIDALKDINDSLGHDAGDEVLRSVADRIRKWVRRDSVVARIGGDEFAVILADAGDAVRVGHELADLRDELASPINIGATLRQVTICAGYALRTDGVTGRAVLQNAELAAHAAKLKGRNRIEAYQPPLQNHVLERIQLTVDLDTAVRDGQFVVYYQPAYALRDGRLIGAEALLRWNHPRMGLLQPSEFMQLIEASPHVDAIGAWVLHHCCALTARVLDDGIVGDRFHVSVNVAPRQLYAESFVQTIRRELAHSGIPPRCLILEITESSFLDIDHAVPTLHAVRALGVRLAVDDFGTGYSSLSYLDRLPVDILKIDRSFVADIDHGTRPGVMTRAILTLADTLGLITVAEGVERQSQLDELRANGCIAAQGYLWSPPVPEHALTAVIRGSSPQIRGELNAGGGMR